jgi:hypothetical protein
VCVATLFRVICETADDISAHSKPSKQDNAHTRPASRWHMQGRCVTQLRRVASATVLKARARFGKARSRRTTAPETSFTHRVQRKTTTACLNPDKERKGKAMHD